LKLDGMRPGSHNNMVVRLIISWIKVISFNFPTLCNNHENLAIE
jgi:hypothetical protein